MPNQEGPKTIPLSEIETYVHAQDRCGISFRPTDSKFEIESRRSLGTIWINEPDEERVTRMVCRICPSVASCLPEYYRNGFIVRSLIVRGSQVSSTDCLLNDHMIQNKELVRLREK